MTSENQSISISIANIDSETIFDTEHVLMNYLKLNSFSQSCFSSTNIVLTPEIKNRLQNLPQELNTYTSFASKYFTIFVSQDNAIDIISPLISNFPNSDLGLFLSIILGKHIMECAQKLDNEIEKFEKYKNYLLNIYHSVLQSNQKQKILESICSSITMLIVLGINGNWTNGLEQLIEAVKSTNPENNFGNILMTSLIISNINDVFEKLKEKISIQKADTICAYIKGYSNIIKEYVSFLIKVAFNGPKENFVNTLLFKAFIGIVQSLKYFDINILKIHGFLDFLINCVSYLDINHELINQICDIFEYTFSDKNNNIGLFFEAKNKFKMEYFMEFLNTVILQNDFPEIKQCIELLLNVNNYYANKKIEDIKNNSKDLQILFTACNIFSSLCENFSYVFFINNIDSIVQDIFYYFISLNVHYISQILFNSLKQVMQYIHFGYDFNNYEGNEKEEKKNKFSIFLYNIHNAVFENMKINNDEYNNIDFKEFKDAKGKSIVRWDNYIKEILKESINDDEKINYINNATEFYENIYEIINNLYGIKGFFDKMCEYLMSSMQTNTLNLIIIDTIFTVFNKISILIMNDLPSGIFNIIDFILKPDNLKFLSYKRFSLQFILLLFNVMSLLCKNKKYIYLLTEKLLNQKYEEEKMNIVVINFIYKLIISSYQTHKNNPSEKNMIEEDKNNMVNLFNILSEKLLGNMSQMSDNYLLKLIDSLFSSCFFNIYLGLFSNDVIFNIGEKFFKDANEIYNLTLLDNNNINVKELYMKYVYILFSIIKNIGNENAIILSDILNKIDPNSNNMTYFINMENNISNIISNCSAKDDDNNKNIITSIILLYNTVIKYLKEKTYLFNDIFQNIINKIHTSNPDNIKIFELTISLYKNIFTYCSSSPIYIQYINNAFDIINIINSKYNCINNDEDKIYLSSKMCEFIILYFPKLSNIITQICDKANKNNSVFSFGFNNLIETFENNDNQDYNYTFSLMLKLLCENDYILNNYIKDYILRISTGLISHLQKFKSESNKCVPNYIIILKKFLVCDGDNFMLALKKMFNNDQQIIFVIIKYLNFVNFSNYNNLETQIKNYNKTFIKDMGELQYALDKKKVEFVSKYLKIADGCNNNYKYGCINNSTEISKYQISILRK